MTNKKHVHLSLGQYFIFLLIVMLFGKKIDYENNRLYKGNLLRKVMNHYGAVYQGVYIDSEN